MNIKNFSSVARFISCDWREGLPCIMLAGIWITRRLVGSTFMGNHSWNCPGSSSCFVVSYWWGARDGRLEYWRRSLRGCMCVCVMPLSCLVEALYSVSSPSPSPVHGIKKGFHFLNFIFIFSFFFWLYPSQHDPQGILKLISHDH